jgi:hypothetical protein
MHSRQNRGIDRVSIVQERANHDLELVFLIGAGDGGSIDSGRLGLG